MPRGSVPSEKTCVACGETKPLERFALRSGGKWYRSECKPCMNRRKADAGRQSGALQRKRRRQTLRQYGLTPEEYDRLVAWCGGCAICGADTSSDGRALAVDHCADSRHVRGVLCSTCNRTLGQFEHDPERFRRAAEYLESPPAAILDPAPITEPLPHELRYGKASR